MFTVSTQYVHSTSINFKPQLSVISYHLLIKPDFISKKKLLLKFPVLWTKLTKFVSNAGFKMDYVLLPKVATEVTSLKFNMFFFWRLSNHIKAYQKLDQLQICHKLYFDLNIEEERFTIFLKILILSITFSYQNLKESKNQ